MKKTIVYLFLGFVLVALASQIMLTYSSYRGLPKTISKQSKAIFGITLK